MIGRAGLVTQKISDSIVVLAMCEPAHENRWRNLTRHLRLRRYLCVAGGIRQVIDPCNQDLFLVTPRHNQLSSSVLDALGRFVHEQRSFWTTFIYEYPQTPAKRFNFLCRGRIRGKMQPRRRCDAILDMTAPAVGLFQNRVEFLGEKSRFQD